MVASSNPRWHCGRRPEDGPQLNRDSVAHAPQEKHVVIANGRVWEEAKLVRAGRGIALPVEDDGWPCK